MRSINGIIVHAKYFAFDGCHKFYLLHDNSERSTMVMRSVGWEDDDFYPIEELPMYWDMACPLKFISSSDLTTTFAGQFEEAYFEGWD